MTDKCKKCEEEKRKIKVKCFKCKKEIDLSKSYYSCTISNMHNINCSASTSVRTYHVICGEKLKEIFVLSEEYKGKNNE